MSRVVVTERLMQKLASAAESGTEKKRSNLRPLGLGALGGAAVGTAVGIPLGLAFRKKPPTPAAGALARTARSTASNAKPKLLTAGMGAANAPNIGGMPLSGWNDLGIDPTTVKTKKEVKQAFLRRMRKIHPDVNKATDAHERTVKLNSMYDAVKKSMWFEKLASLQSFNRYLATLRNR